jgi:Protein of unknown function (DUF4239)
MSPLAISLIVFACVFGGAMLGMVLRSHLPEHHQNADSQRVVNLGAGIIGTMAALVLGLLVASAKGTYDAQNNELTVAAAKIVLLDRGLSLYGPEANDARSLLRSAVNQMVERLWPDQRPAQSVALGSRSSDPLELFEAIEKLSPQNDLQRSIKAAAIGIVTDIGQTRWLMYEQESLSISKPLLVILVFWLTINFFSFGLFAPRNATVIATLCLCALAVAGAIFLILELYRPFGGFIQIPSSTLTNALAQLGH